MELSGRNKAAFVAGMMLLDPEAALDELRATEAAARATSEHSGLAEACMYQCYLRSARGEFDEVEYYMSELTRLGERAEDAETTLFGMVHLANTLMWATDAERAVRRGEEALRRAEEAGHLKFQAEVLTVALPFAHLQLDQLEEALSSVERGMEIATRIGDHASEMLAAIIQGKAAMHQGYYSDAIALFRRAERASQQTGLPYFMTLGRCVTGTCYSSIGGALRERASEIHAETLELAAGPLGDLMGAWVWTEVGQCALAAGEVDAAEQLFQRALEQPTMPMYVRRPHALAGMCDVAIARGEPERAQRWLSELREYVDERGIRSAERMLLLAEGRLAAVSGDHPRAIECFERLLGDLDGRGFLRDELDVHAAMIESYDALGDEAGALAARAEFERVVAAILPRVGDDRLRVAFSEGALDMLAVV